MGEHEHKPVQAKPLTSTPQDSPKANERVAPFPARVELRDQIVNSSHLFDLVTPRIGGNFTPAKAVVSIAPADRLVSRPTVDQELDDRERERHRMQAFSPAAVSHDVLPGQPIQVRFWPTFTGDHEADVKVMLRWSDGLVDLRTIRVAGHARRLDEAPANALDGGSDNSPYRKPEPVRPADLSGVASKHSTALTTAFNYAQQHARNLAAHQKQGVKDAEREATGYKRKQETDGWTWLLELAISMGVAGVAGLVAKAVASNLGRKISSLGPLKNVERKTLDKYTDVGIADTVKEGIKNTAKSPLINALLHDRSDPTPIDKDEFFSRQERALIELENQNALHVIHQHSEIQHGLVTDPEHAIAVMEALSAGLQLDAQTAMKVQQEQTRLQWVAFVGGSENGRTTSRVSGERRQTTDLSRATGATRGVLRIRVVHGVVRSASIDGVTQKVANGLLDQDLARAPIPLVILEGDPTSRFITRDEVGRVRIPYYQRDAETQAHDEAQLLVDTVVSKPLSAWGVTQIVTDAARGGA